VWPPPTDGQASVSGFPHSLGPFSSCRSVRNCRRRTPGSPGRLGGSPERRSKLRLSNEHWGSLHRERPHKPLLYPLSYGGSTRQRSAAVTGRRQAVASRFPSACVLRVAVQVCVVELVACGVAQPEAAAAKPLQSDREDPARKSVFLTGNGGGPGLSRAAGRQCAAQPSPRETSKPRPTGPPRHQKSLSPFRQNATVKGRRGSSKGLKRHLSEIRVSIAKRRLRAGRDLRREGCFEID
jgi:hypothetical protein